MLWNFLGGLLRGGTGVPQVSGVGRVGGLGFRERVRTSSFTCRFFVGSNGMEKRYHHTISIPPFFMRFHMCFGEGSLKSFQSTRNVDMPN